jgi:transcriptional regulator with PAS, ATPase and Fis domain
LRIAGSRGAAQAKVQKILVLGESGTGKEATTNAIHSLSKRANGHFVSRMGGYPASQIP